MIVVADTSPLNYLILLGRIEIPGRLFGRVILPSAVLSEMRHIDAPEEVRTWASAPPDWVEERAVQQRDTSLPAELGAGECEAISLSLEVGADLLLIDERAGRREAEARNITVSGTLAVLLHAAAHGDFDFPESLRQLRRLGFRVSKPVEDMVLTRYEDAMRRIAE